MWQVTRPKRRYPATTAFVAIVVPMIEQKLHVDLTQNPLLSS